MTTPRYLHWGENILLIGETFWQGYRNSFQAFHIRSYIFRQSHHKFKTTVTFENLSPAFAADAIAESVDAEIPLIVCITEGIPVLDTVRISRYLENKPVRLIGPNCPGLITPGANCKIGIMPGSIHQAGRVGVVSRSGTLTYEAVGQLTNLGIGQSSCVGIGGDQIIGTSFVDVLRMFNDDPETDMVVFIGEIGGTMEQQAADYIKESFGKPICALIVGSAAPAGKRMGHAGAIITGDSARAESKIAALQDAGAIIIPTPADIGVTAQTVFQGLR